MSEESINTSHHEIHFKDYRDLSKLESVLKLLTEAAHDPLQISVLVQFAQFNHDLNSKDPEDLSLIQLYWQKILHSEVLFGFF